MTDLVRSCPACGTGQLSGIHETRTVQSADGTVLPYSISLLQCHSCEAKLFGPGQSLTASRARAAALRAHDGLLTPDEIRAVRGRYSLSQVALEELLGAGPKTAVRWEGGTVCQSQAIDKLIRLLDLLGPSALRPVASTVSEPAVFEAASSWVFSEIDVAIPSRRYKLTFDVGKFPPMRGTEMQVFAGVYSMAGVVSAPDPPVSEEIGGGSVSNVRAAGSAALVA